MLQPTQPVTETDAAAVVATSGSTAAPKGVVLSRGAIRASIEATHDRLGGIGDWILALPPHYVAGLMVLARAYLTGTRVVRVHSDLSDLPKVARGLAEPRYISLVPAQLDRALERPDVSEALASLSSVLVGGGPTDPALVERAAARGVRVVTTYGMSETCGGCVYDGRPLPGVDVELDDDDRIMIRSRSLFSGYRLRPDLTAAALVGGRFRTQDRGRWQAGRLIVLGRTDDIVITGGHKVDLEEVERCAQRWAADRQARAVVLGIPDAVWGTVIIAASDSPGPLEDMQAAVCQSLPVYAMPRELIHLDPLPWLASGKPDRVAIRSMIMKMHAERQAPV
jgi:o-succinylbenzoate---CoA ligase